MYLELRKTTHFRDMYYSLAVTFDAVLHQKPLSFVLMFIL